MKRLRLKRHPRHPFLASALALAACGSSGGGGTGPCPAAGSAGSLSFAIQSRTYLASCFLATASSGSLAFTSLPPSPGQTAAVIQLTLEARDVSTGAVCPWYPGATAPLSGGCVSMLAQGQIASATDAGVVSTVWTASAGATALPAPHGALLVNDWATGPGQLASVRFSPGSTLALSGGNPDGGVQVPISGSVTTLTTSG